MPVIDLLQFSRTDLPALLPTFNYLWTTLLTMKLNIKTWHLSLLFNYFYKGTSTTCSDEKCILEIRRNKYECLYTPHKMTFLNKKIACA